MKQGVLILTEAGKDIGFGHYTRCTAIKEQLVAEEISAQMVVFLKEYDIDDTGIIKKNWLLNYKDLLSDNQYSVILVDSYLADEAIYKALSQASKSVIAIDDYNRIVYPTKYVLNPNVFFSENLYKNQIAKCVGGKDYVILRKEFRENPMQFKVKSKIQNVLITIGGSDFRKIQPLLIETFLKFDIGKLKVISPERTPENISDKRLTILPSQSAAGMVKLMEEADIVISACGQTLHELASLGKPTIGICLDVDQVQNQLYYLNKKFLLIPINWNDTDIIDKLNIGFETLLDISTRKKISNESYTLINRDGVKQVVSTIKKVL